MDEDRIRLEDETPHLCKVKAAPVDASDHDRAARMIAVHVEPDSEQMKVGVVPPRIEILLASEADGSDEAIAERALRALFSAAPLRRERIALRIARGRVTLSGSVATEAERSAAEQLVAGIEGVSGVTNLVVIQSHGRTTEAAQGIAEAYGGDAEGGDVAGRIEALFVRQTGLGAAEVVISAVDGKVVLTGRVHSWRERDLAERIAWAAPGVTEVLDRITVG
ncbi:BON domain-containing protein [Roseomonas sp. HJA6]|uniref:BON domain-containing protein n=1 Tax=Roseomonas alba TaxID=2846776 RepID=A0ABS7AAF3_9PROT|nr:BON domain-containing protein [Neoroseomonas alba]MBW6399280.1 BON domain-containing protein [Neoroseomonas alba]